MEKLYSHKNEIAFRKVDRGDLDNLLSLKNESWFGTHTITIANSISQEKWLESISCDHRQLFLIAYTQSCSCEILETPIGLFKALNIDWVSRRAEVGWDVYKQYRNQGYGKKIVEAGVTFCFNILNLRRLDAQILTTNAASLKCAVAAGFQTEGRQPNAIFKNGEYVDNILLGVMKK